MRFYLKKEKKQLIFKHLIMSTATKDLAASKQIRIYSQGFGEKVLDSKANTWKELQAELDSKNINYSGMKSVIGESQLTLESPDAVLPAEGFTLFLMPIKTKSGAAELSYKELRSNIQSAVNGADGDRAKAHFNAGKNYTTKGTDELRSLWASWKPGKSSAKAAAAPSTPAKAKATIKEAAVKPAAKSVEAKTGPAAKEDKPAIGSKLKGSISRISAVVDTLKDLDFENASAMGLIKKSIVKLEEAFNILDSESKLPKGSKKLVDTYNDLASKFKDVRI